VGNSIGHIHTYVPNKKRRANLFRKIAESKESRNTLVRGINVHVLLRRKGSRLISSGIGLRGRIIARSRSINLSGGGGVFRRRIRRVNWRRRGHLRRKASRGAILLLSS
jgi:hypothetical protein